MNFKIYKASKLLIIVLIILSMTSAYIFLSVSEGFIKENIQSESFTNILFDKFNGKCNLGVIKTKKDTLLAVLQEKGNRTGLKFELRNVLNGNLNTYDIYDESASYMNNAEFNEIYSDINDSATYFITSRNNADMYLNKYKSNDGITIEKNFIFRHPDFDQMIDSTIAINGIKYFGINLINDEKEDSLDVVKYNDGYKILLKKKLLSEFHIYPPATGSFTNIYQDLIKIFKKKYNIEPDLKDILRVRMFFNMRGNYLKHFNVKDFKEITDFMRSNVFGKLDANNDGIEDVLILINGNRFFNDYILCYDEINNNVIWQKEFSKDIIYSTIDIIDIDSDNVYA